MPDFNFAERTQKMRAFIDAEHFRYSRFAKDGPAGKEIAIGDGTPLVVEALRTPLLEQALADFGVFFKKCMDVSLSAPVFGTDTTVKTAQKMTIRLRLSGTKKDPVDVLDPSVEAFALSISDEQVLIEAGHERGLLHGTHYVERLMADRGAPYLAKGKWKLTPKFAPRLTNSIFIESHQKAGDLNQYDDKYLSLMSHFGANGIHLYISLWDYCRNGVMLELNSPDFTKNIAELNAVNERMLRHGIDMYLMINNYPPLAPDHPAFQADPARRGAKMKWFLDMPFVHNLCSGNESVLACYEEALENLFRAAPGLAGAFFCVGGEGIQHCYSRPYGVFEGYTNCPHCQHKEPSEQIARLCNRLAGAIKRVGRHKAVFMWPYSAFTWSGNDQAQLRWMEGLSEDACVISNFDTNNVIQCNDSGVILWDYNITSIGPTEYFTAQARKAATMGRRIYTKTESNTTADAFSMPYIPVHFRWHQRFLEMAKLGVAGYIGQWRFYGMNGSPPEELQYHAVWNPEEECTSLLTKMARRDFGISSTEAKKVVHAWKKMSAAWDDYPYSALTAGEREFYMRGPMHLGPAHPLIFNVQSRYDLSQKFRVLRGDAAEASTPEMLKELQEKANPTYISELLMTLPYGVRRYLELLSRCRRQWAAGMNELKEALGPHPSARAQMEIDVCETIDIHLATLANVVRFYEARERLWRAPSNLPVFRNIMTELAAIIKDEIANAERSLPILARDNRIGYIHCYGIAYDADMVREKLRQCYFVLNEELPLFDSTIRFHIWNNFP